MGRDVLFPRWEYAEYFNVPSRYFVDYQYDSVLEVVSTLDARYSDFSASKDRIKEYFSPSKKALSLVAAHEEFFDASENVAIHVHSTQLPMDYYRDALLEFPDARPVVFSNDTKWAKANTMQSLGLGDPLFMEDNEDWLDLFLMSFCEHHIVDLTSLSWWGAFLSDDERPICPKIGNYIFPEEWEAIQID